MIRWNKVNITKDPVSVDIKTNDDVDNGSNDNAIKKANDKGC
ncbi:hypothetical protein [Borreliella americana]|nr:hypothetical protein [Borreliella americana]